MFVCRWPASVADAVIPLSIFFCRYELWVGQSLLRCTRFVKNISNILSLNKFIIKMDSTIYLMILIMYHKY
jgi:hypothetical protein